MLARAYRRAETKEADSPTRTFSACWAILRGAETLAAEVSSRAWDKGWNYTGMGQFGPCMSELDSLIIALGPDEGDIRGLDPILEKVEQIDAESEFSHSRAVAMALETLGHPDAAKPLARLAFNKPGMCKAIPSPILKTLAGERPPILSDNKTRNDSLRELSSGAGAVSLRGLRRSRRENPERSTRATFAPTTRAMPVPYLNRKN